MGHNTQHTPFATCLPLLRRQHLCTCPATPMAPSSPPTTSRAASSECRHLEILAAGCVPLFSDLDESPPRSLNSYPRRVLQTVLQYPGLKVSGKSFRRGDNFSLAFDDTAFDKELYVVTVTALLHYTRQVLSTASMARYFLRRVTDMQGAGAAPIHTVLFLVASEDYMDYLVYMLLHGLKSVLGQHSVVDHEHVGALLKTTEHFDTAKFADFKYSQCASDNTVVGGVPACCCCTVVVPLGAAATGAPRCRNPACCRLPARDCPCTTCISPHSPHSTVPLQVRARFLHCAARRRATRHSGPHQPDGTSAGSPV